MTGASASHALNCSGGHQLALMVGMIFVNRKLEVASHHDGVKCLMKSFRFDSLLMTAEPQTAAESRRVTG